ncbi:MAG: J domain-containing protein [Syntrophaceae bacterium]|nr:J domain-containing protein [Syntrophaceae bacterium]
MDTINLDILRFIRENPGTSRASILEAFHISEYRLNRALRGLKREYPDMAFPWSHEHGMWLVQLDRSCCLGMEWSERRNDGYVQCHAGPTFSDGKCYEHSSCESPEMIAFLRKLSYCLGPREPNPMNLLTLGIVQIEEFYEALKRITPLTGSEFTARYRLVQIFASAYTTIKWKRRKREEYSEFRIPPEFAQRHRDSSINPFEFSLKKLFALLDIPPTATRDETLKAWKMLARLYHPDSFGGIGNEEKMKELNLAKERIFKLRRWD